MRHFSKKSQEPVVVEGHLFEIRLPENFTQDVYGAAFDLRFAIVKDVENGVITTLEQLRQVPLPPGCTLVTYPVASMYPGMTIDGQEGQ